jgi:hypothetical protein
VTGTADTSASVTCSVDGWYVAPAVTPSTNAPLTNEYIESE